MVMEECVWVGMLGNGEWIWEGPLRDWPGRLCGGMDVGEGIVVGIAWP